MKKIILISVLLIFTYTLMAQIPQAIKYQTIVRGSTGEILPNQYIGLQVNIREGSSSGTIVYQETHYVTTNQFGMANLEIGTETPLIGSFPSIDWQTGLKFMEVELDPTGSSGFTSMGTTQLVSVPYALYAESAAQDGDWTITGDDLYTSIPGNVGIGTSSPVNGKLEVVGDGTIGIYTSSVASNAIYSESSAGGGFAAGFFNAINPGTYGLWAQSSEYEALYANTLSSTFPAIRANGEIAGVFDGKVGIGANNPHSLLHIGEGTDLPSLGNTDLYISTNTSSNFIIRNSQDDIEFGIGVFAAPFSGAVVQTISNDQLYFRTGNWDRMMIDTTGNVIIGYGNPKAKLEVKGDISAEIDYKIDTNTVLSISGYQNIMVGKGAGGNNTGTWVTLIGDSAGYNNQSTFNVFAGTKAGYSNTTGYHNTFLGTQAGYANTEGLQNTFVGNSSGQENTFGALNTYLGCYSGLSNSSGTQNTFIGYSTGSNNLTGNNNTFIGSAAGADNTGNSNVFIGYGAGYSETGSNKLIIANGSLDNNIAIYGDFATGNIGLGTTNPTEKLTINGGDARILGSDGWDDPGDQANLFLGDTNHGVRASFAEGLILWTFDDPNHDIRFQDNTGTDFMTIKMVTGNVGIGTTEPQDHLDIYSNINDWNNLTLTNPNGGTNAGSGINFHDDGSGDAYIAYANPGNTNALSGPKSLTIQNGYGPIQIRTGFEEPLVLQSYGGGNVGIAVLDPQTPLHINQKSTALGIRFDYSETSNWHTYVDAPQDYNFAYNGTLKAFINDTDGSYNPMSDISLKKDIAVLPQVLKKVTQLQPCSYRFKDDNSEGNKSIGLIAQEVEPLFPEVVNEKDGVKGINYDAFAIIAIQAIKEQQEMIEKQQLQIEELKNMISNLVK